MPDVSENGLLSDQIEESVGMNTIHFNDVQLCLVSEENVQQIDREDEMNQFISFKNPTEHNYCINRIMKKLKDYINCSNKNRRFLITIMICLLALPCLTAVAYLMPVYPSYTTINTTMIWYQNEIIYEINVPMFRDSTEDGKGDLKGILEKLDYLENNNIQSILLQSSIFNVSDEVFELSDRQYTKIKTTDLLNLDPQIGTEDDFRDFMEILARKNIHLIVDLPLSSTGDHKDLSWYGFNTSSSIKIENPCLHNKNDLGCKYYKIYKQLPLDFSNKEIADAAESRLRYWLLEKNVDGIRVDLPLTFDRLSKTYQISFETIHQWKIITKDIENKTTPKLLLFDIPFNLQAIIDDQIMYSIPLQRLAHLKYEFNPKYPTVNNQSFRQSFWQIGSSREYFRLGMMHDVSQRIFHTIGMLIGGTPIVLYGDELGIKQRNDPWMIWTSDPPYGGFSSCLSEKCNETLSSYDGDFLQTNVQRQEINVDIDNESLLIFFRRLSKLRQHESFRNGVLKKGYESTVDILWFSREAPGHRGFLIVIHSDRFKEEAIPISLQNLTKQQIPNPIYYEYRSANIDLLPLNSFPVKPDKLLIYPGSIHIFWWPSKVI